ncbi:MAG: putative membrane protein required for colicin V production [Oceanicoccus sp.]|jgi:uncharacterized membrane protein required for colicin V production
MRGMFLGLSGVIGRLVGFIAAYLVAFFFRLSLAEFISSNIDIRLPLIALQMISGFLLFVGTLFVASLLVSSLLQLCGRLIPGLKAILDNDALAGKIAGASINGTLAAFVVLLGIWGFGKVSNSANQDDPLQQFANRVGETVFAGIQSNDNFSLQTLRQTYSSSFIQSNNGSSNATANSPKRQPQYRTGSAEIISSNDPSKVLRIESVNEIRPITQQPEPKLDIAQLIEMAPMDGSLMESQQVKDLLNNPEIRKMALEQIQKNPEKLQQILNNPQLRELFETLSSK